LIALVKENKIDFIIVDQSNRSSQEYLLNEDNIRRTYECVYSTGEGDTQTAIYDTQKVIRDEKE